MLQHYHYAGIRLASGLELPELPVAHGTESATFCIEVHAQSRFSPDDNAAWRHDVPTPQGQLALTAIRTETCVGMQFPRIADLWMLPDGRIGIWQVPEASDASLRHVLLDQALPRFLAQRGEVALHAAMIRTVTGRTLLLLGESGRGKSTLTGAFLASGCDVLTDDGAIIDASDQRVNATPTYPSLRLLPDSLRQLFPGDASTTRPMAHYSNKRRVIVDAKHHGAPLTADAILVLGDTPSSVPALSPMTPSASCLAIMRHGFQLDVSDTANVSRLLAKAAEVARRVPTYQLDYPRDYAQLSDVVALLNGVFD